MRNKIMLSDGEMTADKWFIHQLSSLRRSTWFCSAWLTSVVKMFAASSFFVEHSTSWAPIVKFPTIVTPNVTSTVPGSVISVFIATTVNLSQTWWNGAIPRHSTESLFNESLPVTYHIPGWFFITVVAFTIWISFTAWMVNLTRDAVLSTWM